MKEQLETRLNELRNEYSTGTKALEDLQRRQEELRSTLLRISGAIQVLEEMMQPEGGIEG
jgi:prefoldin subunit 5